MPDAERSKTHFSTKKAVFVLFVNSLTVLAASFSRNTVFSLVYLLLWTVIVFQFPFSKRIHSSTQHADQFIRFVKRVQWVLLFLAFCFVSSNTTIQLLVHYESPYASIFIDSSLLKVWKSIGISPLQGSTIEEWFLNLGVDCVVLFVAILFVFWTRRKKKGQDLNEDRNVNERNQDLQERNPIEHSRERNPEHDARLNRRTKKSTAQVKQKMLLKVPMPTLPECACAAMMVMVSCSNPCIASSIPFLGLVFILCRWAFSSDPQIQAVLSKLNQYLSLPQNRSQQEKKSRREMILMPHMISCTLQIYLSALLLVSFAVCIPLVEDWILSSQVPKIVTIIGLDRFSPLNFSITLVFSHAILPLLTWTRQMSKKPLKNAESMTLTEESISIDVIEQSRKKNSHSNRNMNLFHAPLLSRKVIPQILNIEDVVKRTTNFMTEAVEMSASTLHSTGKQAIGVAMYLWFETAGTFTSWITALAWALFIHSLMSCIVLLWLFLTVTLYKEGKKKDSRDVESKLGLSFVISICMLQTVLTYSSFVLQPLDIYAEFPSVAIDWLDRLALLGNGNPINILPLQVSTLINKYEVT